MNAEKKQQPTALISINAMAKNMRANDPKLTQKEAVKKASALYNASKAKK